MKLIYKYIFIVLFCFAASLSYGQNKKEAVVPVEDEIFTIRGSVYIQGSRIPIEQVDIEVNNGTYTTTNKDGKFVIKAKIGDQLTVMHKDFETIFHTIESGERITIEVTSEDSWSSGRTKTANITKRFNQMIDSADAYLKKDAEKSIKFVGDALNVNVSPSQSAEAHELLGDIYMYWKQYDLAISAYKISIQNTEIPSAKLKLAKAYEYNGDLKESISTYGNLNEKDLSNYQKALLYEGVGDANLKLKNIPKAITSYEEGLKIAKRHLIAPKVTDLNSKIAQAYNVKGDIVKARGFFDNSLDLAAKENKKRSVEEKIKVAEFNSENQDYESEIELRKQALEDIEDIEKDSIIPNESPLTSQKQNYKIGNALILQNRNDDAIPFLEESRKEADKKGDLVVGKDATRKLSEALIKKGDTEEGLAMIENYENIVDELYAKKEQEISQAARFSRNLAIQQNRITALESDRALSRSTYELTQEKNKRQQLIIYSLIGGLVLLLITGFMMYKYIKQQRLANNLLALKSLRSQMNPHFIFNALNSVNSFIATNDERTANKYLSDFSHLMRSVLENSEEDFIPLKKEIELLDLYTKLEHFRFQDKFDYSIKVDESIDVDEFQIPPMLLQPYIENAVWHGLRYKTEKGHLSIEILPKSKNEIAIVITDDGIGRERSKALKTANQKKQNSKGMNNIKKRVAILNEMYKDKVDVTIEDFQDLTDVGTKVVVTLKKD
ncbi:tetratricopeptide repeat-containing sensor histidine kinase [Winogradskyella ouciana]|uniref:Sensor histidine kinase n=1 Tax=Winogradskyella ouciana TaxID=2608631 RepID=A0A7K1GGI9_9FLAO|nr:sensor histidine kinase [Winogradskyella ouciana]